MAKKLLANVAIVVLFALAATQPVLAGHEWVWITHYDGQGRWVWTQCMPAESWNGHKNHPGHPVQDVNGGPCTAPDPTATPQASPTSTPTGVPPTETATPPSTPTETPGPGETPILPPTATNTPTGCNSPCGEHTAMPTATPRAKVLPETGSAGSKPIWGEIGGLTLIALLGTWARRRASKLS